MTAKKQIIPFFLFVMAMISCATVVAQTGNFNNLQIYNNLRLGGRTITGISNDSTFADANSVSVPTSKAVKSYVDSIKTTINGFSGDYNDLTNKPTNVSAFTNDVPYLKPTDSLINRVDYVPDISSLENYIGNAKTVVVQDALRGGTFNLVSTGVPDSGTIFKSYYGLFWKRSFGGTEVNVRWFGAIGDGVTDDAAAFNAMIVAMPANGGKVHLMSKTYLISSTVTVNKSILFEGGGSEQATTIQSGTDNMVLFRVVEDGVTFKNIRFNSSQSSPTAGCAVKLDSNLRTASQIQRFTFSNDYFNGFYNQIEATGAYGGTITSCLFQNTTNYGIWIANMFIPDAGDSYITGCTFIPKDNNSVAAIYQTSSGGLKISNNKFNQHNGYKFKYSYLGNVSSTVDLIMNGNSFENYQISAVRLTGVASFFENISISGNQFASYTTGARTDINIDSCSNISIQGNSFVKQSNDTAILLTKVSSTNINNSYKNYGYPVIYSGSNSDLRGDGSGVINQYLVVNSKGLAVPTTLAFKDTSGVARITTLNSAGSVPVGYISDGATGKSQLTFASNINPGSIENDLINSNTSGGGFSFWQQTSSSVLINLLNIKSNKNIGFGGITNPIAYADIPAGTGTANTGQIHLAPGKASNGDGYFSYDTTINGKHLYFNIGGTQYRLDSQSTSGSTGVLLANGTVPLTADWNVNNHSISGVTGITATTGGFYNVTANNTISASSTVSGSNFSATQYNFGTGTTTGLLLRNGQPASSGTPVQNSLMALWTGSVWDGSTSQQVNYRAGIFPISGTNTSEWKLSTNLNTGTYSDVLKVKSDGRFTLFNVINLKAYTVATLPAGTIGDVAYVTDASSPTYLGTLTGGGSTICPVFYNGTAWVAH